ncbi:MAG: sigma-70 family RNA polymerase sigma factor, partial [Actinomycetes bacterium]
MDDSLIVQELVLGNVSALEFAYRKYSDRLFTYARSLAPAAAEDAVADTFLLANARIGQLRDPAKLRPWLYAICRNECLRELRRDNRHTELDAVIVNTIPAAPLGDDSDAAQWITAAYQGMNKPDVEILTLALNHDLGPKEIALICHLSPNDAAARLSRARKGLEESLSALVLFRTGTQSCDTLRDLCADAEFNVLLRKRITKHARHCSTCGTRRNKAGALILGTAAWAMVSAPASVKEAILVPAGPDGWELTPAAQARMTELDQSALPFDGDGWPLPTTEGSKTSTLLLTLGAMVVVALMALLTMFAVQPHGSDQDRIPVSSGSTASASTSPSAAASPST